MEMSRLYEKLDTVQKNFILAIECEKQALMGDNLSNIELQFDDTKFFWEKLTRIKSEIYKLRSKE